MPKRKLIEFDGDTYGALKQLADDRMATFQELADEAFADLLKKHHRPVGLAAALKESVKEVARQGSGDNVLDMASRQRSRKK